MSNNIELYLASLNHIKKMLEEGIINEKDFNIAEAYLAKKHCIKDKSLYRLNELIIEPKRVINIDGEKEVKNGENNNDKTIKKIE